jgi:phosphopantetheinyl transferase
MQYEEKIQQQYNYNFNYKRAYTKQKGSGLYIVIRSITKHNQDPSQNIRNYNQFHQRYAQPQHIQQIHHPPSI